MLRVESAALLVVDIQERLRPVILDSESLVANAVKLIVGMQVMGVPIVCTEQYPKGLGSTVSEVARLLEDAPIEKTSFSCCDSTPFMETLEQLGRRQIIVAGIETHICVYQTVSTLLERDYEVEVAVDAVSSRTASNKEMALMKLRDRGAALTSVEMALFELCRVAEGEQFKQISRLVK